MEAYVPLWQTLAWIALVLLILSMVRKPAVGILEEMRGRIKKGAAAEFSSNWASFKVAELQKDLPRVPPSLTSGPAPDTPALPALERLPDPDAPNAAAAWNQYRKGLKKALHDVYMTHVISPSNVQGQRYDIYVYLVAQDERGLEQVERAQFFLGPYWGNEVFDIKNDGGRIGFSTAAYGPALCVCRIRFTDGSEAITHRFLDFESGELAAATRRDMPARTR